MAISAVIIACDEEKKIEECLRSIDWVDEIILVDAESKDKTAEIAKRYRAKVYQRVFDNFSNQKNYGLREAKGDWILSIDADERVTPELRESLEFINLNGSACNGFYLLRKNQIFGKYFYFGGNGPEKLLRFFKKGMGWFERPVHEKVVVDGKIGEVKGELLHLSTTSFTDYKRKLHLYTKFEAEKMAENKMNANFSDIWLKPMARFFYFYLVKLGFLDGLKGLFYQALSSYYLHLKYQKLKKMLKAQKI